MGWFKFPHLFWSGYGEVHSDGINTILTGAPLPFNYTLAAQDTRDAAGVQTGETVGVRTTPGLNDEFLPVGGTLTDNNTTVLNSDAAVAAIADSGDGLSESTAYVVANRRFDNSESQNRCITLSGADAYYVKFVNCWWSGYNFDSVYITSTNNTIILDSCLFTYDGTTGSPSTNFTNHVNVNGGSATIKLTNCLSTSGGRNLVKVAGAFTGSLTLTDCRMDSTAAAWTGVTSLHESSSTASYSIVIQNCEIVDTTSTIGHLLRITEACAVTVNNTLIDGTGSHTGGAHGGAAIATPVLATKTITMDVTNCIFRNQSNITISIYTCDGVTINYCEFDDSAYNARHIYPNGTSNYVLNDININHCKLTSSVGANAECIYALKASAVVIEYNWVNGCSNDAYEFVNPQAGCICRYNVADNVVGQIVDCYDNHATNPGGVDIHHIYGDCGDSGVIISNCDNCTISNIYIDTSAGSKSPIQLEQRDALGLDAPDGVIIYGPVLKTASGSGYALSTTTATADRLGAANTYNGIILSVTAANYDPV